jgi:dihydrofolate reductase
MRKLIVSVFMTADGVIDHVDRWGMMEGDHQQHSLEHLLAADLLVLGRKTYEGLASVWPDMKGDSVGFKDPVNAHLWKRGLVDELRLWTHPVVFGKGQRPFHSDEPVKMQLAGSTTFSSGVTLMCFKPWVSR